jgi:hypothetical protein
MVMTVKQAGRKRWAGMTEEERQQVTSKGGQSAWADMTPTERSAEMKRRAKKRKKKATPKK